MGNYLLYSEDLAGIVALNLLLGKNHRIVSIIDCSGRLIELAFQQGFSICQNMELLPESVINQIDGIMIGVATEPLATELKKELTAKFPQKKISTLLDPEYLPGYLSQQQAILQQLLTVEPQLAPVQYGKGKLFIYADSKAEQKRANNVQEKKILAFLQSIIKPKMVVYDIGANIGIYSLILGRENPRCQIHAFEPETVNFWKLLRNIELNKLTNVTPHLVAIGAKREIRYLSLQGQCAGLGQHSFQKTVSNLTIPVSVWDLDSYIKKKKISPPDLVKIDVEGFELQVLKGMKKLLAAKKTRLMIEVHEALAEKSKLEGFLKKNGYDFKELDRQPKRSFLFAQPSIDQTKQKVTKAPKGDTKK
ncbi:MAG TPA: FkbM family methyltransferase [Firmicutes bacterium]|jgi:FkbM family methyltransferase|nr:FkbM family methyltransferase [Bacillota bacterium]